MPFTNDSCDYPGTFESECEHGIRIIREAGQLFPPCGPCRGPVEWIREMIPLMVEGDNVRPAPSGRCPQRQAHVGVDSLPPAEALPPYVVEPEVKEQPWTATLR